MEQLFQHGLSNAAAAAVLAILAAIATRIWRNPYFAYAAWLIVLVRLVAPPLVPVNVPMPAASTVADYGSQLVSRAVRLRPFGPRMNAAPTVNRAEKARTPTVPSTELDHRRSTDPPATVSRPIALPSSIDGEPAVSPTEWNRPQKGAPSQDVRRAEKIVRSKPSEHPGLDRSKAAPYKQLTRLSNGTQTGDGSTRIADSVLALLSPLKQLSITQWLIAIWLCGTFGYLLLVGVRAVRFSRALRAGRLELSESLRAEAAAAAAAVGLPPLPRVAILAAPLPPFVWPGWRPTVLLPQALVASLSASQRRLLLLHEFVHLRRLDHRVRWFQIGVVALCWWNPVAWWASKRLERAEEECCDAAVLRLAPDQADGYGQTLVTVTEFLSTGKLPAPALSIGIVRANHLKRRLDMILNGPRWPQLSKARLAILSIAGCALVAVSWTVATAQDVDAPPVRASSDSGAASLPPKAEKNPANSGIANSVTPPLSATPRNTPVKAPQSDTSAKGTSQTRAQPGEYFLRQLDKFEAFKPAPGDDNLQKLLKERYNAALGAVKLNGFQYELAYARPGGFSAAVANFVDTRLAMAKTPDDKIKILEWYVDFATKIWKMEEAKLIAGGVTSFTPIDEAETRAARLEAEIRLLRFRDELKNNKTVGAEPNAQQAGKPTNAIDGAAREAAASTPTKQSSTSSPNVPANSDAIRTDLSAADSRPDAVLSFAGLAPDDSAPLNTRTKSLADLVNYRLQEVQPSLAAPSKELKERYNDALRLLQTRVNRFKEGKTSAKSLCRSAREFTDARMALYVDPLAQVAIAHWYKGFALTLWRMAEAEIRAGLSTQENQESQAAALDAYFDASSKYRAVIAALPALASSHAAVISPTDDERQKLLTERFNAALRHFRAVHSRWHVSATPFRDVIAAARELSTADAARSAAGDLVAARQREVELMRFLEKLAENMRAAGGLGPDEIEAIHAARLDAEVELFDAKRAAGSQKPTTSAETKDMTPVASPRPVVPPPGSRTLPELLTAESLKPAGGDDERHKLLKERYNSALGSLQWSYKRREVDHSAPFMSVLEASRQVFAADVALAKPQAAVAVTVRYLDLMKFLEQKYESEFKSGYNSRDELDAVHAARLDAEIKLLDARRTGAAQERPTTQRSEVIATPSTRIDVGAGARPLQLYPDRFPAWLIAQPIQVAPGDDDRRKRVVERYNVALHLIRVAYERLQTHPAASFTDFLAAAHQLFAAEVALHKSGATYEHYLELMKFLEDEATSMRKGGTIQASTYEAVHEARLDAEVKLLDARGGTAPGRVPPKATENK
jgi:beta-lactamase regulating signal transducer with metallopeptidase domain